MMEYRQRPAFFTESLLILVLATFCASCSRTPEAKTPVIPPTSSPFTFGASLSPTPVQNAMTRYSDFRYHYRKVGDETFADVASESVKPTNDGSVRAEFTVTLQQ